MSDVLDLLHAVRDGSMSIEAAEQQLRNLPFDDLGFAKVDHHRKLRVGYPEVIYTEGKDLEHLKKIVKNMIDRGETNILCTRASKEACGAIRAVSDNVRYHDLARIAVVNPVDRVIHSGTILVVTGGTADISVAEEAAITAEVFGNKVERLYDVGVAGIHRLLANRDVLDSANVIIAVAGMEGALASVVGGLVDKPVIAVPTSVGYGANFGGIAPLLAMLNSCASGVAVMNIDNGFGAGYFASVINKMARD